MLDHRDLATLQALQEIGLISLGTRPAYRLAATGRVGAGEAAGGTGVIIACGARVDLCTLNLGLMTVGRLRTTHERIRTCLKLCAERPEIIEVHRVNGEKCFILKAVVPVPGDLAELVEAVGPFGTVTTCVVLQSEPKPIGCALLAAARR